MPIPGPRTQQGPLDGYRNPDLEVPHRFNRWDAAGPVRVPGESPGTMQRSLRGTVAGPGTIRRFWRQSVNLIAAQPGYSWSGNRHLLGAEGASGFGVTRALRYMTRSVGHTAGTDNTRFAGLHTTVKQTGRRRESVVTAKAGLVRNRPTVRNRLSSFGSRVPTLNERMSADQS